MARVSRRIAVITGTRAEFGLLEPVLRALRERKRLEVRLIATGMHLLPKFGQTVDHIRAAGWRVDAAVAMQSGRDGSAGEPLALARGIEGIGRAVQRLGCEVVLVLGDRVEAFAGACAAAAGRRILAHIHGGDRATGDVDDALRNAITRLAHVHLVASEDAARRLKQMGEEPFRIHRVGAPGLDDIREALRTAEAGGGLAIAPLPLKGWGTHGGGKGPRFLSRRYAVVVQHPIGRSGRREAETMSRVLTMVEDTGLEGVILYPNSDPGHEGIVQAIRRWQNRPGWQVIRSLPRPEYLRLVHHSALLIGNSSSGIIESAGLGVNAVNVGPRQEGRLRCGSNVIDCGESAEQIRGAIRAALRRPRPRPGKSVYGDGRAGQRIAEILEGLIISPALQRKRLTY